MINKQIILRPVFDRPEMLKLSFEYEIAARKYYMISDEFTTVFAVEYKSPQKIIDLIEDYPFEKEVIIRTEEFGLSKNILEGMKDSFDIADEYIIYIEDDVLVHKTYFKFIEIFLDLIKTKVGKFSYLSGGFSPGAPLCKVSRCKGYNPLGPLISKKFFVKYVEPCAISTYYERRSQFCIDLSKKYYDNKNWRHGVTGKWNAQAGLIARLMNIAEIEENMYGFGHTTNRQRHIGFYGANRKGELIGKNFEERLERLRNLIMTEKSLCEASKSKYEDYYIFPERLNRWDGKLILV